MPFSPRLALLPLLLLAACRAAGPAPQADVPSRAAPSAAEEREVVAAVEGLFEAMRTRDTVALRAAMDPSLVIVSVATAPDGAPRMQRTTVTEFIARMGASPDELRERMWSPEVRIDGTLATLWAPYDFHRGGRFSHCGHDAVHLVRREGAWVVTGLAYTVQRTGCPPAPAPR